MNDAIELPDGSGCFTESPPLPKNTEECRGHYEKVKYRNFRESSRLEGIELPETPPDQSLQDVIEKYKQTEKGR